MYSLALSLGLGLVAITAASPFAPILLTRGVEGDAELGFNDTEITFTEAQLHENALASWPADLVIKSADLPGLLSSPAHVDSLLKTEEKTVYLSDTHTWVTVNTAPPKDADSSALQARQSCVWSTEKKVLYGKIYMAPWHTVSPCLTTGDSNGGEVAYSLAETYGVSYGGG